LITTLLDATAYSAKALADLYCSVGMSSCSFRDIKTDDGHDVAFVAKTPDIGHEGNL